MSNIQEHCKIEEEEENNRNMPMDGYFVLCLEVKQRTTRIITFK
jgi:hypothetical protein